MPKGRPKKRYGIKKLPTPPVPSFEESKEAYNAPITEPTGGDPFIESYAGFSSTASDLTNEDKSNIIMIRSQQQYLSLRRFFVLSARDFYRQGGVRDDPFDAKMHSRIGIWIEDMINAIDSLSTSVEPAEKKDAYDLEDDEQAPQGMSDEIITAQP